MKLAEALLNRADCQKRLAQLKDRLRDNAQVQEGESPAENPEELLQEYNNTAATLTQLVKDINRTNALTYLEPGKSFTDILAERDELLLRINTLRVVLDSARVKVDRYSRTEIKQVPAIDIAATQKVADDLAKQYRLMDLRIQEANWRIDLITQLPLDHPSVL